MGARTIDLLVEGVLVIAALLVVGDSERPIAAAAIAWLVIVLYEAVTVAGLGTTLGKAAVGLRVVELDQPGRPSVGQALRRGAVNASFAILVVLGWVIWLVSTLTDALGRGIADRAATTMVTPKASPRPVTSRDLPGYADGVRPPRLTAFGRVGDLDVRMRARLRRLSDSPVLAGAVGLLALAAALPVSTGALVLLSSGAWLIVFIVDETVRVHRSAATAGHRLAGLVIRDRRTGTAPSTGRSLARAIVLALTLYVPVLWPLLVASMIMIRTNDGARGLHDLAGGTVVVADPSVDPEAQRQMAMRMRVGRAR
ncbi:hypothetical protein BH23ACT2_BH23ACT2_05130 [soil metagenome]